MEPTETPDLPPIEAEVPLTEDPPVKDAPADEEPEARFTRLRDELMTMKGERTALEARIAQMTTDTEKQLTELRGQVAKTTTERELLIQGVTDAEHHDYLTWKHGQAGAEAGDFGAWLSTYLGDHPHYIGAGKAAPAGGLPSAAPLSNNNGAKAPSNGGALSPEQIMNMSPTEYEANRQTILGGK